MVKKCIKIPFVEEITKKPGASVRFVEQHTVPLDATVEAACKALYVMGQPQLVKSNFLGLFRSMAEGVQRDGMPRKIADFIRVYPVFTGAVDLDKGFDPKVNGVYLAAELLNEMKLDISKWSFEDVTQGRKPIVIESVKGVEIGVVDAAHDIALNGRGLAGTHTVEIGLEGGEVRRVDPAHVTGDVSRMDVAKAALAELAKPENDGKALTITVRGNFAKASKTVTYRYVEPVDEGPSEGGPTLPKAKLTAATVREDGDTCMAELAVENAEAFAGYDDSEAPDRMLPAKVSVNGGEERSVTFVCEGSNEVFLAELSDVSAGDTVRIRVELDPAKADRYAPGTTELTVVAG